MTEEVNKEATPKGGENTEVKQLSPIEEKALEMGWRPQEEWDGEPEDFIDAKEFVRRQPLFDKIEQTTKALKDLKKGHEALIQHHLKVKETEYNRALETLKAQRKQALREGEGDMVVAIEERMEQLNTQKDEELDTLKQQVEVQPTNELPVEAQQWVARNKWYEADRAMKAVADAIAQEYRMDVMSGKLKPSDVLTIMEREVRKEFPHKFRPQGTQKPGSVESPSRGNKQNASETLPEAMSEQDRSIMNKVLRVTPELKREDYIKEWKRVNGVS